MIGRERVHLLSYGVGRFTGSAFELERRAKQLELFAGVHVYKQLPDLIRNDPRWSQHLTSRRGAGFWFWKSALAKSLLRSIPEGNLLLYVDSGCRFTENGWADLCRRAHGTDLLVFQYQGEKGIKHPERRWTKGDIFHQFKMTTESEAACSGQIIATYFILRNTPAGREFIDQWEKLVENFHLVSDEDSIIENWHGFSENRHDQSLFSVLIKSNQVPGLRVRLEERVFPEPETWPIHTLRRSDKNPNPRAFENQANPDDPIVQHSDGTIELIAVKARRHGTVLRYLCGAGNDCIGFWTDTEEWVDWQFTVTQPGPFKVFAEVAGERRSHFQLAVGDHTLNCVVDATDGFCQNVRIELGIIELASSGETTLSIKPDKQLWRAINLKSIQLTPIMKHGE